MNSFIFSVPTQIFFGEGQVRSFAAAVKTCGERALIVYGGGSVKKNGIYEEIASALKGAGVEVWEFGGIEPNPRIDSVRTGIDVVKKVGADVIVPIGGGSVIDAAKLIAAGTLTPGDPWAIVKKEVRVRAALPICAVLTLAATGSEMDTSSVITNLDTKEKLGWKSSKVLPKASLMNPAYTATVSAYHTAAGTADIMSHTMENYFSVDDSAYMQDSMAEGILRTCVTSGRAAVKDGSDLEARANLMWASSWAINGLLSTGKSQAWSVHPMEHELSAFYDITHGVGLAILTPRWLSYVLSAKTAPKIARFGRRVFDISEKDDVDAATDAIDALYDFFASLSIPMNLKDVGIGEENLSAMAKACAEHAGGVIRGFVDLKEADILAIYKASL